MNAPDDEVIKRIIDEKCSINGTNTSCSLGCFNGFNLFLGDWRLVTRQIRDWNTLEYKDARVLECTGSAKWNPEDQDRVFGLLLSVWKEHMTNYRRGAMLFSDVKQSGNVYRGADFAKWLVDNNLGKVISTGVYRNPNTSNQVETFIYLKSKTTRKSNAVS